MFNNKKSTGSFIIAGLAAFAFYKYSKMSEEQKRNIVGDLKEKGKKIYDEYAPAELKEVFNKKKQEATDSFNEEQVFS